jgi:signal transduction histidine kinase
MLTKPKLLASRMALMLTALFLVIGAVLVGITLNMPELAQVIQLAAELVIAAVAFALLAALLVFRLLTRRLRMLAGAMEAFRASRFTRTPPLHWSSAEGDEIDRLAHAFLELSNVVAQQLAELARLDAQRRELVANVSHDLRTPLTLMQGYLETMLLRRGGMSPAEERNCLEIAARHAERLGRLVGDLFELTRLDGQEAQPTAFSLSELAQDIAQKFSLSAAARQVHMAVELDADAPPVLADIGLVERALENLVDNALRHTPDAGRVNIEVRGAGERVHVRVRDSGCGIAPADLPHVFDRYFQASRVERQGSETDSGMARHHVGLGLAITQRIVALHGGSIGVESALGVGTVFSFDLPAAPAGAPEELAGPAARALLMQH